MNFLNVEETERENKGIDKECTTAEAVVRVLGGKISGSSHWSYNVLRHL